MIDGISYGCILLCVGFYVEVDCRDLWVFGGGIYILGMLVGVVVRCDG